MPVGRKIVEELLANFGTCHGYFYFPLPADGFAPVLLIQPFLQRSEVIQDRRRVEIALARQLEHRVLPRPALTHFEHRIQTASSFLIVIDRTPMERRVACRSRATRRFRKSAVKLE